MQTWRLRACASCAPRQLLGHRRDTDMLPRPPPAPHRVARSGALEQQELQLLVSCQLHCGYGGGDGSQRGGLLVPSRREGPPAWRSCQLSWKAWRGLPLFSTRSALDRCIIAVIAPPTSLKPQLHLPMAATAQTCTARVPVPWVRPGCAMWSARPRCTLRHQLGAAAAAPPPLAWAGPASTPASPDLAAGGARSVPRRTQTSCLPARRRRRGGRAIPVGPAQDRAHCV